MELLDSGPLPPGGPGSSGATGSPRVSGAAPTFDGEGERLELLDAGESDERPHRPSARRKWLAALGIAAILAAALGMYALGRRDGNQAGITAERQRVQLFLAPAEEGFQASDGSGPTMIGATRRMVGPLALTITNAGAPVTVTGVSVMSAAVGILPLAEPLTLSRGHSTATVLHLSLPCRSEDRPSDVPSDLLVSVTDSTGAHQSLRVDAPGLLDRAIHQVGDCDEVTPEAVPVVRSWARTPTGITTDLELHNLTDRDVTLRVTGSEIAVHTSVPGGEFRIPADGTLRAHVELAMPDCTASLASALSSLNFETGLVTRAGTWSPRWGGSLDLPNDAVVALLSSCGSRSTNDGADG